MTLPTDAAERKTYPLYRGLIKYFPDALAAVAHLSWKGNQQHHPDKPLHWDKSKSTDELDALMRHILDEDWDAVAWRALAHLQRTIEAKRKDERPCTDRVGNAPLVIQDTHTGLEYRITSCPGTVVKPNVHEVMRELRLKDD